MSNQLSQLDEILYHGLRPWLEANGSIEVFAPLLKKVPLANANFNALYEIDFYRPFNSKVEYYQKYIVNATNICCNAIVDSIKEDDNKMFQKRLYDDIIGNVLPTRLTDTIDLIKEGYYFIEYVDPKNVQYSGGVDKKMESYVMQLLKVAFVKVYLEVQNVFNYLNDGLPLTESDIYDQFLNQAFPNNSFLKRNENKSNIEDNNIKQKSKVAKTITPTKANSVSRLSFTYKNFDTDVDKLEGLFKNLKDNGFIAKDNLLANFKRAFSGKDVSNQVIWSGHVNEFYYFVTLLHDKYELIEPIKRNHWSVACKCFIRFDGTQFDKKRLKSGVKPEANFELLEQAAELLK